MSIGISGITPAAEGNDWFLIDKSGEFSLSSTIMGEFWIVGGGSDGEDGFLDPQGFYHGGKGGNGGGVYKFGRIRVVANTPITVTIARENDPFGTTLSFDGKSFSAKQSGYSQKNGGNGGIINPNGGIVAPKSGYNGIETPYGYVGSSGSGGASAMVNNKAVKITPMSKGGNGAGSSRNYFSEKVNWEEVKKYYPDINAVNYGCGGGGNTFCGGESDTVIKSHGKGGCVIIRYSVIENDTADSSECTIRFWG